MKRLYIAIALCTLIGCRSSHTVQLARQTERDSTFHRALQYDSIHVYKERKEDYRRAADISYPSTDTLVIKETSTEYRYRFIRDTVSIVRHDSIPYEVVVSHEKVVRHIPWWSKALSAIGGICLLLLILCLCFGLKG
ncbi:MAG: hypothetical protein IKZ17_03430 [Bacteroidaceae bacterium]|nr:hypothetical protein [Bacteroidaceae bacterium]MBR4929846.1 hypothetical protein [Bacteroidaceae bacterium]MBR5606978.1 hypothetical protein [Bacteroidaceae bacterium]MBR5884263.1 hypothetical protein [Bacteroidaceae bacterium]